MLRTVVLALVKKYTLGLVILAITWTIVTLSKLNIHPRKGRIRPFKLCYNLTSAPARALFSSSCFSFHSFIDAHCLVTQTSNLFFCARILLLLSFSLSTSKFSFHISSILNVFLPFYRYDFIQFVTCVFALLLIFIISYNPIFNQIALFRAPVDSKLKATQKTLWLFYALSANFETVSNCKRDCCHHIKSAY